MSNPKRLQVTSEREREREKERERERQKEQQLCIALSKNDDALRVI